MKELKFRDLRADEIDCRVAMVRDGGCSLLLYKDARCDMNILDETVGAMNWQRSHIRDNANCIVSIWDEEKKMWISKEDVGTESNTEAQKGLASDSFKRACFNWGIGRELYTAPFIWVSSADYNSDDKGRVKDSFSVEEIVIEDKKIVGLSIRNDKSKLTVYTYGKCNKKTSRKKVEVEAVTQLAPEADKDVPTLKTVGDELKALCKKFGYNLNDIVKECNLTKDSVLHDYVKACNYVKGKAIEEGKF